MAASGSLFVVATPIGNLEDITLRALRVLREVAVVAAEDTRRTGNLLRHFQIDTPLLSLHEHNEHVRIPKVLAHLREGRSVALVSDAGTPGVSDPGSTIVRAVRQAGLPVIPVPGPSAVTAAMSVGGFTSGRFVFAEFPPIRSKDRIGWLAWVEQQADTNVIFYEAPHRVHRTLSDLGRILGDRPILVGREVTKHHEEWRTGTAEELARHFTEPQGEFVFAIPARENTRAPISPPQDAEVLALFGQITDLGGVDRRAAVKKVAETLQLTPKYVYDAIERAKK